MTTIRQRPTPPWVLGFLAAIVTVLTITGITGPASAATQGVVETRVRASTIAGDAPVEPPQRETAGQRQGEAGSRVVLVVATGVAANGVIRVRPPRSIPKSQFGTKWGKHASDYGLDAGDLAGRQRGCRESGTSI